jgi:hypothetical protein
MEERMQSTKRIGFHESSVVGIRREDGTVTIELEGVHLGDDLRAASIRLTGVQTIIRDGVAVDDLASECEEGEVLTLQHTQNTLHLIVEWTDFKKHQSLTHSYKVECDLVEIEIH